jgi:hypothetical protein
MHPSEKVLRTVARRTVAPAPYQLAKSGGELPWEHVVERLEKAWNYWIVTVRPDGRPHVTPIWGVWLEDHLYVDGHPRTRWSRNIAGNPQVAVHLESGSDVVILEGVVDDINTDEELGERIKQTWKAKYGRLEPEPVSSGILRFRPWHARAWSSEKLEDGTAWDIS